MTNRWIVRHAPRPRARARLFCFAYAGVGASAYRLWAAGLPQEIEVCAAQMPGRENRLGETALRSVQAMVDGIVPALTPMLDLPYAFFGHSMGSVVAFEIARVLRAQGAPLPVHLFVSSRRPPRVPDPDVPMHTLGDDEFIDEVDKRYGGIPAIVREEKELLALLIGTLRADMIAIETHDDVRGEPLSVPITAFGGSADRRAPRPHLDAWQLETSKEFRVRIFDGDHFYLVPQRTALLADIAETLRGLPDAPNR